MKPDVLEYKTVDIEVDEWDKLIYHLNHINVQFKSKSQSWGQSIAEFLRTKSPYPSHSHIGVVCVGRVNILKAAKGQVRIIPEKSADSGRHYTFTYYRVDRLKRPTELDARKIMMTDLGRVFQSQLILSDNFCLYGFQI